jgi:hypothetical protein
VLSSSDTRACAVTEPVIDLCPEGTGSAMDINLQFWRAKKKKEQLVT